MKFKQKVILFCDGSNCKAEIGITLTVKQTNLGREEHIQCPGHWFRTDDYKYLCSVCKKRYLYPSPWSRKILYP